MKNTIPQGNNWMSFIPDNTDITTLAIPGTHDSCAYRAKNPEQIIAKTQSLDIKGQLNSGIRFLDIRGRNVEGSIDIYHDHVNLNQTFKEVIDICFKFLRKNPSETILFCLSKEKGNVGSNVSFSNLVESFYNSRDNRRYRNDWYIKDFNPSTGDIIPQLKELRGKIVLLRRYNISHFTILRNFGIDFTGWTDNSDFFDTDRIEVQDSYKTSISSKKSYIKTMFSRPRSSKFKLNFISLSGANKGSISKKLNPLVSETYELSRFADNLSDIVIMDFPTQGNTQDVYWWSIRKYFPTYKVDVQIRNKKLKEYLYAADFNPRDSKRRSVYTWTSKKKVSLGNWLLIPVEHEKDTYFIYNTSQSEYLFSSDKGGDSKRRNVFTYRKGGITKHQKDKFKWKLEYINKTECYIYNIENKEYLFASSKRFATKKAKARRKVFTRKGGNRTPVYIWEIIQ